MIDQLEVLKTALDKAVSQRILSRPHAVPLPAALPFRASVVSIALPPGCMAPTGPLPLRIGSGVGPTQEIAEMLALMEAAERYALQYGTDRPEQLAPVLTEGGAPAAASLAELTLGAPDRPDAKSIGAAAGASLAGAMERALLEVLEHLHVAEDGDLMGLFVACDPNLFPEIADHMDYLGDQLRAIDLAILVSPDGYCVARAVCRDFDGGRPTLGSAAGRAPGETVLRAAEESILLWRNMVEIEHRSLPATAISGRQNRRLRVYLGAEQQEISAPDKTTIERPAEPAAERALVHVVRGVANQRVRVFDLTRPNVGVAVARVLLG